MPERKQHPTLPDWQYEEFEEGGWFIRHGFREDTPAALPLIVVSARTAISVSQRFRGKAWEWETHAQLPHRRAKPKRG